jgi:hypothetical protein
MCLYGFGLVCYSCGYNLGSFGYMIGEFWDIHYICVGFCILVIALPQEIHLLLVKISN